VVDVAQMERDGNFRGLVRALEDASANGATKANAVRALGDASRDTHHTVAIVEAGAIPILVAADRMRAGRRPHPRWGDCSLTLERPLVAAAGAIPALVDLLRGGSDKGKGNAAGALLNMAYNDVENRVSVAIANAIPPLVELLCGGSAKAAMILSNLVGGNDASKAALVAAGAIPLLAEGLRSSSDDCRKFSARARSELVANSEDIAAAVMAAGAQSPRAGGSVARRLRPE
jgi:vacuolar protein 8